MVCHECRRTVQREDRFCTGCGISLDGVTDTTRLVEVVGPDPAVIADEPTELLPTFGHPPQAAGDVPVDELVGEPVDKPVGKPVGEPVDKPVGKPVDEPVGRTELIPVLEGGDELGDDDPVWAATGAIPVSTDPPADTASGLTADLPATEPITEVWMESVEDEPDPSTATPYDLAQRAAPTATAATPTTTAQMPAYIAPVAARPGFRFSAVSAIALLTGIVTLVSLFATIVEVTSDTRLAPSDDTPFGFRTGTWIADDLADNLSIAGLLAIVLMIAGGVAAGFHWRWGPGLAGGAGLAVAGIAAITLGLVQIPIDAAYEFVAIPREQQFTLTITRDLGYWLMLAAAALGVVLFFAAINDASGDRRGGLNPWIAALGALAAVVAAAGPLLPEQQAIFSDNWYLIEGPGEAPSLLLVGRLVQLGLLLFAGVVGFLTVRRWGLGLAIGGALPVIWLASSTLFELTDKPVGPGFRNPGAVDMHLHGVTIIGVSALAAMAILAVIAAYDQGVRERR